MTAPTGFPMPVEVAAPGFERYAYGLLSAASVVPTVDDRWEMHGVVYQTEGCTSAAALWEPECPPGEDPNPPNADKVFAELGDVVEGLPFLIYEGVRCPMMTVDEARTRAERRFAHHEQFMVEQRFHAEILRTDATTLPGTPSLAKAVGLLEDYIAETYGGIGVIHVPREFGALFAKESLSRRDGARMRSPLDNLLAFGAGYANADPDGDVAAAGNGWLYATGPVVVRRGEVQVRDAFDQRKNTRLAVAERSYVITADCPRAAVQFTHPEA